MMIRSQTKDMPFKVENVDFIDVLFLLAVVIVLVFHPCRLVRKDHTKNDDVSFLVCFLLSLILLFRHDASNYHLPNGTVFMSFEILRKSFRRSLRLYSVA